MRQLPSGSSIIMYPFHASQWQFQVSLDYCLQSSIKATYSLRDSALLNSISASHAGSWLRAVPNLKLGLAL